MDQIAIMFVGVGGTGKSTAATELVHLLHELGYETRLYRFDAFRKGLTPPGCDPFSADPAVKDVIYDRAIQEFRLHMEMGGSLLIDGGLSSERIRQRLKREVPGLRIVHLYCPLFVAILRDTRRSLLRVPHERGWFLHLRAVRDLVNPFKAKERRFPQPAITYPFEFPQCADLHISTLRRTPAAVAAAIVSGLGIHRSEQSLRRRLQRGAALLSLVDRKRIETGAADLGGGIESMIVERELRDLFDDRPGT